MHIGLYFGSFNPVHVGHMVLANYMLSYTDMQQVWLVVSPQNPHKSKMKMLGQNDRLILVNIAIDDHPNIRSSNVEFALPQPSYTINTLAHLKEKHPEHTFSLIMGQDNLHSFGKWKNYEMILKHYHIYVYPRTATPASEFDNHPHVHLTAAPVIDISSTFIRQGIRDKKDLRFFLPGKVWDEIDTMNFYRN
jgi:nicotinate-nucleotide adenylyltransferase